MPDKRPPPRRCAVERWADGATHTYLPASKKLERSYPCATAPIGYATPFSPAAGPRYGIARAAVGGTCASRPRGTWRPRGGTGLPAGVSRPSSIPSPICAPVASGFPCVTTPTPTESSIPGPQGRAARSACKDTGWLLLLPALSQTPHPGHGLTPPRRSYPPPAGVGPRHLPPPPAMVFCLPRKAARRQRRRRGGRGVYPPPRGALFAGETQVL
jgi:hypothetical protein